MHSTHVPLREVEAIEYDHDLNPVPMVPCPTETDHTAFDSTIVRACGPRPIWTRGAPR